VKPRLTRVALALASVLLTTGCGEGAVDGAAGADGSPSAEASVSAAPGDTSPREVTGRSASNRTDDSAAVLENVEVSGHGAFDRVRFDFSDDVSKVFAEYLDAFREPGRGRKIPLAGEHRLVLVFVGTGRHVPSVDAQSAAAVREVRAAGVFEGELTVGIGTHSEGRGPGGFRVRPNGKTVLVDIAHRSPDTSS
jgi:hypothetical protein